MIGHNKIESCRVNSIGEFSVVHGLACSGLHEMLARIQALMNPNAKPVSSTLYPVSARGSLEIPGHGEIDVGTYPSLCNKYLPL